MKENIKIKQVILAVALLCMGLNLQAADSESNRKESHALLGISSGVHVPALVTHPLTVGFYLNENFLLGVEYGTASFEETDERDKFELDYINKGLYMRYFLGNSFNILGALHQRSWEAKATLYESYTACVPGIGCAPTVSGTISGTVTGSTTVATAGIGNQWLMDWGFTIGCDWLVLSYPISSSVSEISIEAMSVSMPFTVADSRVKEMGDLINLASAFPGVLILTLGWSF